MRVFDDRYEVTGWRYVRAQLRIWRLQLGIRVGIVKLRLLRRRQVAQVLRLIDDGRISVAAAHRLVRLLNEQTSAAIALFKE